MERKLILTPGDHAFLYGYQEALNKSSNFTENSPVDVAHFFLSAITMAGVDCIQSILPLYETRTTLIKRLVKKTSALEWANCLKQSDEIIKFYSVPRMSKQTKLELFTFQHIISQLLFAMKSNSSVLLFSDFNRMKKVSLLPPELTMPFKLLFSSIQSKNAQLPIVKYNLAKKDIRKLIEVLTSKEFNTYKEAHSEIEKGKNLTSKTISRIEKAGKDLYRKNNHLLNLRESLVKAVPLSPKVIELYFGKLPGVLTEFSSKILVDYLGMNNTIPFYSCDSISNLLISQLENQRLILDSDKTK